MVSPPVIAVYQVRKPYTITKQREKWTEEEHQKFLDALKLYGRTWRRIEEHVGTKTAVQIRSHAQKFFSKLEREASAGGSAGQLKDIEIPPPRPKRKPNHPYPRKAGIPTSTGPSAMNEDMRASATMISSFSSTTSISMRPDVGNNYHKAAAFTPYVKGARSAIGANHRQDLSFGSPSFIKSKESLTLFGKPVVVPSSKRVTANTAEEVVSDMGFHINNSNKIATFSKDVLLKKRLTESETSTSKYDLKQRKGFFPYAETVEKASSTDTPCAELNSDMSAQGSGIDALHCGESITTQTRMSKDTQVQGAVSCNGGISNEDINTSSNHAYRKQTLLQESVFQTVFSVKVPVQHTKSQEYSENKDDSVKDGETPSAAADDKRADLSDDMRISDSIGASNNSSCSWLDNFSQYHANLPVPPHLACGSTELFTHGTGPFGSPLMPYHLLQLMALRHPAAYAATGWPGVMTKTENTKLSEPVCTGHGHIKPNIYVDAGATAVATATIAAASAWWALHGLMPPGYINPTSLAMHMCAGVPGAAETGTSAVTSTRPALNVEATECMEDPEEDQNPDAATDDETTSEGILESVSDDHSEKSPQQEEECAEWIKHSKTLKSALHATPGRESCFPSGVISCCEASSFVENHLSPLADEDLAVEDTKKQKGMQRHPISSADERNERRKRSRERSSSGSNTPVCGHQTSDPENLNTSGSDVSGNSLCPQKQSTVENVMQGSANVMQIPEESVSLQCNISKVKEAQRNFVQGKTGNGSVSEIILQGEGCLKIRFKSLEKGEKTQHKDRSGGDDGGKHFKSSAYDTEQWKEVSEEGRKAFQALFSHKTLPQTFSPPSTLAESRFQGCVIEKRLMKSPQSTKKLAPTDVGVACGSVSEDDAEVCCNPSYPLAQTRVYSKEMKHKPAEAGHFLEEMETQKEQTMKQEINAAPGREIGRSPHSRKLKTSKMAGMVKAHQQSCREDDPSKVQNLVSSGRSIVSAALSCKSSSQSVRSGFIPYQRPSTETMTSEKR